MQQFFKPFSQLIERSPSVIAGSLLQIDNLQIDTETRGTYGLEKTSLISFANWRLKLIERNSWISLWLACSSSNADSTGMPVIAQSSKHNCMKPYETVWDRMKNQLNQWKKHRMNKARLIVQIAL